MEQLRKDLFWLTEGKLNRFVLEPLNFADDVVRGGNRRKRALLKNWSDTLFVDLNHGGWARSPHFWLTSNFYQLYLMLQRCRMSSECFWKLSCESKVIPRNFT